MKTVIDFPQIQTCGVLFNFAPFVLDGTTSSHWIDQSRNYPYKLWILHRNRLSIWVKPGQWPACLTSTYYVWFWVPLFDSWGTIRGECGELARQLSFSLFLDGKSSRVSMSRGPTYGDESTERLTTLRETIPYWRRVYSLQAAENVLGIRGENSRYHFVTPSSLS